MSFSILDEIKTSLNSNSDYICRELKTQSGSVFLLFFKIKNKALKLFCLKQEIQLECF